MLVGPCQRLSLVIVGTDVGGIHLIGHTLIGFYREIGPTGQRVAVVDDHIGNGADALGVKVLIMERNSASLPNELS